MPAKTVLLSPRAQKDYASLEQSVKDRIKQSLNELAAGSKRLDIKKLKGTGDREDLFRLRVGDYRIIYSPESDIIRVVRIDHRGKDYSWLA